MQLSIPSPPNLNIMPAQKTSAHEEGTVLVSQCTVKAFPSGYTKFAWSFIRANQTSFPLGDLEIDFSV